MLDHIEERVELLREHAVGIETERSALLQMLSTIKSNKDLEQITEGEKEEIEITAQRLLNRTLTVEISVSIPRNEIQQKALNNVNKLYDDLLVIMKSDLRNAKAVLEEYINACRSDCRGSYNQKFQAAILECTADDQKKMRKQLESLLNSIPRT
ncbi:BAG family molecular chaperone regulator 2 [Trichonephila inaurata madagascariensis]|uniref:BAG family molecular chaperone regulator 2 n=1 Tax=Trichonephila inaurata madagascariensis TaxID=2747483 RepID=A0A8X7CMX5_9ARAC|nr:BAG family molecular chaperone regulator 2 [Trichonephila inaurata madagascariensis]